MLIFNGENNQRPLSQPLNTPSWSSISTSVNNCFKSLFVISIGFDCVWRNLTTFMSNGKAAGEILSRQVFNLESNCMKRSIQNCCLGWWCFCYNKIFDPISFLLFLCHEFVNFEVITFLREKEIIKFFNFDFTLGLSPMAISLPFTGVQISYINFTL